MMLVGEQPGDQEDLARRVFVGPAGEVLDEALKIVRLDRSQLYLTNAVKAFKHEVRGKFRIHQTPRASDVSMCRPWLDAEIDAVRPDTIVCLGASAALAVLGRVARIEHERGRWIPHATGARVLVSYHPAAVLRAPDQQRSRDLFEALRADLQLAADWTAARFAGG
jgi:DNA polymerase